MIQGNLWLMAEIVVGLSPAWYVLQIFPAHERVAAAHLVGRRFGIYLPELNHAKRVARGRHEALPMFPGYIFIFTWLGPRNHHRIVSCPGVFDFLRQVDGEPATIDDAVVNAVRAVENQQRPLTLDREGCTMIRSRKRGFRRYRKIVQDQQTIDDTQIVGVHTWSALHDGLRQLDDSGRNRLLHEALGC